MSYRAKTLQETYHSIWLRTSPAHAMMVDSSAYIVPKQSIAVRKGRIAKLVEEAPEEDTILEVESVLEDASKARDFIASQEDEWRGRRIGRRSKTTR